MKTLRMLTVGTLLAATAGAALAADEAAVSTITVTAKRAMTGPSVEHVPPRSDVQITMVLPTDMPEAEIEYHLLPLGAAPAPAVERPTP